MIWTLLKAAISATVIVAVAEVSGRFPWSGIPAAPLNAYLQAMARQAIQSSLIPAVDAFGWLVAGGRIPRMSATFHQQRGHALADFYATPTQHLRLR